MTLNEILKEVNTLTPEEKTILRQRLDQPRVVSESGRKWLDSMPEEEAAYYENLIVNETRTIEEMMADIGAQATANGLTPEILEALLADDSDD